MKNLLSVLPIVLLIACQVMGQEKNPKKPVSSAVESPQAAGAKETSTEKTVVGSPLNDLAWMVGTWVDKGDDSKVVTECSWVQNGKFLKRSFSVQIDNEVILNGDQFIGWDPIEARIRSWTFDSEGGIGEGRWYQDGNRWIIKTTFRLSTGKIASATNVITFIDENTITWQSIGREIAGELLPSIPKVTVVRQGDAESVKTQSAEEKP